MSTCRLLCATAALAVIAGPAMAQAVIWEPGFCAFYYPNANCQNKGPGNPYTGDYQRRISQGDAMPGADPTAAVVRKRSHTSRLR